jgi:transcriptional regulator with XRE-family HTH domain
MQGTDDLAPAHRERQRIGATLRTLREMRGLKADQLAALMNISRPYLANIEAGRKPLTPVLLARAAEALDVRQIALIHPDSVVAA